MRTLRLLAMAAVALLAAFVPTALADDDDDDGGGALRCGPNLVVEGDFEAPPAGPTFVTYAAPLTFGAWRVTSGSIDHIGLYWQAASGVQSVDLSGLVAGTIQQDIVTEPGARYVLRFALSGNPDGPPSTKQTEVRFGGDVVDQPTSASGASRAMMNWGYVQYTVEATSALSALEFESLTNTPFGPALDDVSLCQILDDDDDDDDDGGGDDDDDDDDGGDG
jgi:choice-of-anchor C domain-containing protein